MNRYPAVAGQFYPAEPEALTADIENHLTDVPEKMRAIGVVSPHAGFIYSGDTAGAVYSRIEIPDTVILIGPNHTGQGERVSVMTEGTWCMPLGDLSIDGDLAKSICAASPLVRADSRAHLHEHCIETQLPFLQYFRKDFKFVPICMMRLSFTECIEVSQAILSGVKKHEGTVLIVASSDMTHYESHASASEKDKKAIDQILRLDAKGLYTTVEKNGITMCGVIPATVMLLCANAMGAHDSELVKYMTSGEVSGDLDHVVGYAGMIVK